MFNDLDPIVRQYKTDPVFHNFVEMMVQAMEFGKMTRYSIQDALRMADHLCYVRDLERRERNEH